jgi:hypothetical protein
LLLVRMAKTTRGKIVIARTIKMAFELNAAPDFLSRKSVLNFSELITVHLYYMYVCSLTVENMR